MESCRNRFCSAELLLPSLEVFTYSHGRRKGGSRGILKLLAKKAVFSISSGENQISPLLAPLEKIWGKSPTGPPWKKSFRRPCLQLPCPCSASLPLCVSLHQHACLLNRQHMHTFWRRWLAGHRCRCWTEGAPGQIPVVSRSWGVATCFFCRFQWWGWSCDCQPSPWSCRPCVRQAAIAATYRWGCGAIQCRWLLWGRRR